MSPLVPPEVKKIAVLRANGIGDFVFTLPALDALRHAFPGAEMVLLGKDWHREFLTGRPGPVDRVVVVPRARGVSAAENAQDDEAGLATFFRAMRAEDFDLAFQLHGGGRYSNPFINRLGARATFGLKTPDAEPLDRWLPYVYFQPEVFRFLEVVSLAGVAAQAWEPYLVVTAADQEQADLVLPPEDGPLAVLNLGAGDPRRRWPPERFADVARALLAEGARVVLNGTGDERELVTAVKDRVGEGVYDLGADCTLSRLVGALARAAVVVSSDSGPLHLARAVGAPSVGLYWCGNLVNAGPTTRARHRPFVSWQLECAECRANTMERRCGHAPSFIDSIPSGPVAQAAVELLALRIR